jgi:hypothetical protein
VACFRQELNPLNQVDLSIQSALDHLPNQCAISRLNELQNVQAQNFLLRVATQSLAGTVDGSEVSIEVVRINDFIGIVEERQIPAFTFSQQAGPARLFDNGTDSAFDAGGIKLVPNQTVCNPVSHCLKNLSGIVCGNQHYRRRATHAASLSEEFESIVESRVDQANVINFAAKSLQDLAMTKNAIQFEIVWACFRKKLVNAARIFASVVHQKDLDHSFIRTTSIRVLYN